MKQSAIRAGWVLTALTIGLAALIFVPWEPILRDRAMRAPAEACPRLDFGQRRCDAVVARAIEGAGVRPADVVSIRLGRPGDPTRNLGGYLAALARLTLADGRLIDEEVWCTGIGSQYRAWCADDPQIELFAGANHDMPCTGEDAAGTPEGCATPIVLDPDAVAKAVPLRVNAIDIPATVGHHEVELGRATLPNGYLGEVRFGLADPAPDGVLIPDGIRLVVTSTDASRPPLGNVYERGTFPGVEEVVASLVFDVVAAPAGAILQFRDVVVR